MLQKVFQINHSLGRKVHFTCIGSKPWTALTPEKHTYMTHNAHNVYDEPVPYGAFPKIPNVTMLDSFQYVNQIQNITNAHFKSVFPKYRALSDPSLKNKQMNLQWHVLGVPNFQAESEALLYKLANGIIVKESKYTWVKEQQNRFKYSLDFSLDLQDTPFFFYFMYNRLIWRLVEQSHNYESPEVKGHTYTAFTELQKDISPRPQIEVGDDTFLNRLVARIHS